MLGGFGGLGDLFLKPCVLAALPCRGAVVRREVGRWAFLARSSKTKGNASQLSTPGREPDKRERLPRERETSVARLGGALSLWISGIFLSAGRLAGATLSFTSISFGVVIERTRARERSKIKGINTEAGIGVQDLMRAGTENFGPLPPRRLTRNDRACAGRGAVKQALHCGGLWQLVKRQCNKAGTSRSAPPMD